MEILDFQFGTTELIFAGLIAIVITVLYVFLMRNRGPWKSIWPFFFVIFLGVWSASFWIHPIGSALQHYDWVPLLYIGFIIALLLASVVPVKQKSKQSAQDNKAPDDPKVALNVFFWLLILVLLIPIIIGVFF